MEADPLGRHEAADVSSTQPLHSHGEPTSIQAAESMREQAQRDKDRVLDAFSRHGPMTPDQCAAVLGWEDNPYRARRRCSELKQSGAIEGTGTTRKTKSGRAAEVLRVRVRRGQMEMGF